MITVGDLEKSIGQWVEDEYIPFVKDSIEKWNAEVEGGTNPYRYAKRKFDEAGTKARARAVFLGDWVSCREVNLSVGTAVPVDSFREDSKYYCIFKIGEQYFRATTEYDSWNDWDWDYASIDLVKPESVTVTRWVSTV